MNSKQILFSLFHHDVDFKGKNFRVKTEALSKILSNKKITIKQLSGVIYTIVTKALEQTENISSGDISLTLTGGMDSRVILACLLKAGVKPNCFTFGPNNGRDVIFARNIAKAFNLPFQNVVNSEPEKDWYFCRVKEVIKIDNGNSHLHRAHRLAAIAEHCEQFNPRLLFTGHMGGEGIHQFVYNNYLTSRFFEEVNEGKKEIRELAESVLNEYFIRQELIEWKQLLQKIRSLPYMQPDKKMNKFYFLYNLAANIHHAQDLRLYNHYVPKVVPVYLQNEYLETLFSSKHHFLAKPDGIRGKLMNPKVHTDMLQHLYPDLLEYPLSNGYKPADYQKGLWYVGPKMVVQKYIRENKFEPTFSYGEWYVEFVKEHATNISDEIWEIYDKERYMKALYESEHRTDEGYWHKFSNPIFFDLVEKHKKGELTY